VTAVVLLGDIAERPTQRYLVTELLNMWEVSMGGSHKLYLLQSYGRHVTTLQTVWRSLNISYYTDSAVGIKDT
jgi:hypothetical protein